MRHQTKFKQTEIGMIPEDWEVVELKDLLTPKGYIRGPFGSALRRPELKSEGVPVYEQANAIDNHRFFRFFIDNRKYQELKRFKVETNDLVISCSGTFGKVTIISKNDTKGIISQALLILRPNTEKINPNFLKYFFSSDVGYNAIASRSLGSVQVNIGKRDIIEKIQLAIPQNRNEQDFIIKILSSLDSKIELNQQMNKTLEAIGQAIFKHWFIDFEFPNEKGKPYKSSGGEMVDSELGEIPKGWEVGKLGENSFEITRGFTTSYVEKSGLINLNQKVNRGEYLDKNNYRYYPENIEVPENKFAKQKDILVNSLGQGTLGRIHFFWENKKNIVVDQHITIIRANEQIFPEFLYFYLTFPKNQQRLEAQITGSTGMLMLNISKIRDFIITLPERSLIKKFSEVVSKIYSLKAKNINENECLSQIRDSLLPKLMSGKIRVPLKNG